MVSLTIRPNTNRVQIIQTVLFSLQNTTETRMWANAQRDGCPVEYRWCPLRLPDGRYLSAVQ